MTSLKVKELIEAAGHGAKEGLEGLAEFSEKVALDVTETTRTLKSSSGDAIHNLENGADLIDKMCLIDKHKKSPTLEVLGRAVLGLRSVI